MENKLRIGIIGLGTVGCGTVEVLKQFDDIEIVCAVVKNLNKIREVDVQNISDNVYDVVSNPDIDVVVEVAGGCSLLEPLKTAIKNKKHIVTANKELLACHGAELFDLARENETVILYEAAVAGGIPIINPIKTSLKANEFSFVAGILNGTTNYILTRMEKEGLSYQECLKSAQDLGYAEADPTNDVEGFDSMFKIAILANIVFNKRINLEKIYREGISKITSFDIKIADELGYKIKLVVQARNVDDALDIRVHPMLVPIKNPISDVKYATNAVMLEGHPVQSVMFVGPGAGKYPTASSVVGDIIAIKSEFRKSKKILPLSICTHKHYASQIDINETINSYYISFSAGNNLGTIGKIGSACAEFGINLTSIIQKGIGEDNKASIILITEPSKEENINKMLNKIQTECDVSILNKIRVMK